MYEEQFPERLSILRSNKGISARDMSLSLGQNPGYINNIETGKALPSMSMFFYICEFLEVTPSQFFDLSSKNPEAIKNLESDLKRLSPRQLQNISDLVSDLIK